MKGVVRPFVVCNDPKEFIAKVMLERNLDPKTTDIKIGADDGQGLFKLNVQLLSHYGECTNPGRARYSDVSILYFFCQNYMVGFVQFVQTTGNQSLT